MSLIRRKRWKLTIKIPNLKDRYGNPMPPETPKEFQVEMDATGPGAALSRAIRQLRKQGLRGQVSNLIIAAEVVGEAQTLSHKGKLKAAKAMETKVHIEDEAIGEQRCPNCGAQLHPDNAAYHLQARCTWGLPHA